MSKRHVRTLKFMAVITTAVLSLSACALVGSEEEAAEGTPETYKVAFIGPLSGPTADLVTRPADAVEVLFDRINAEGGVELENGDRVKLELTREDTQGTPQGQTQAIRKASRDADALIGGMLSSPTIAGMDVAESESIPYNIVGAVSATIEEKIAAQDMKFVFHSAPNAAARASADIASVVDLLDAQNFHVISQDTDYGRDMVEGAEAYIEAEVPNASVTVEYVPAGATQFSTQMLKVREASPKPDVIYAVLAGQEMFSFMQQKHSTNDTTMVYGASSTPSSNIYIETLGADVADGTITNSVWLPGMSGEAGDQFTEDYEAATGRLPADVEVQAYDGALMLIDAMKKADSLGREDVAAAMLSAEVDGLRGKNVFDPETHGTPDLTFVITQIQGGEFVPVWPEEAANGEIQIATQE